MVLKSVYIRFGYFDWICILRRERAQIYPPLLFEKIYITLRYSIGTKKVLLLPKGPKIPLSTQLSVFFIWVNLSLYYLIWSNFILLLFEIVQF